MGLGWGRGESRWGREAGSQAGGGCASAVSQETRKPCPALAWRSHAGGQGGREGRGRGEGLQKALLSDGWAGLLPAVERGGCRVRGQRPVKSRTEEVSGSLTSYSFRCPGPYESISASFVRELRPLLPQGVLHSFSGLCKPKAVRHTGSQGRGRGRGGDTECPASPQATGGYKSVPHGPGGEGREAEGPPGCGGTGSHTHTHDAHARWPRPCPCSPPWGGASPLPAPCPADLPRSPLPPPLRLPAHPWPDTHIWPHFEIHLLRGCTYSCWGVLGFSGCPGPLAFWD